MDEPESRQALADFLRTRRTRRQSSAVGLLPGGRRRTPGLRREEVADLANVGVSWYTLLEQGRAVHATRQVFKNLARALMLNATGAAHLYFLAGHELSPPHMAEAEQVTPALQGVDDALDPHLAFVIGRRWDALIWNRAADLLFHFQVPYPPHSGNYVWRFFPASHALRTPTGRGWA